MPGSIVGLTIALTALWASACCANEQVRARSILVLDQSELRGPFYHQLFLGLSDVVTKDARSHTTLYVENLDLGRFSGAEYEQSLQSYIKEKYRDRPIGVVVAVGAATLKLVLRWRNELWPNTPVVFALVGEMDFERLRPLPNVTGSTVKISLASSIAVARAVVPELRTVAMVGDSWDRQVVFQNWQNEIPSATDGLKVVEIIGKTMDEISSASGRVTER